VPNSAFISHAERAGGFVQNGATGLS